MLDPCFPTVSDLSARKNCSCLSSNWGRDEASGGRSGQRVPPTTRRPHGSLRHVPDHLSLITPVEEPVLSQPCSLRVLQTPACARPEAVELEKKTFWMSRDNSSNHCFSLQGPCQGLCRDWLFVSPCDGNTAPFPSAVWQS